MPKVVDLDRKKAEIAHKALYAFAFEGYHKASLGAIARMCHIGRTTIYEYFRNKDEIFSYALSYSFGLLKTDLQQVRQEQGLTSLERITAIARAILAIFYRDKRVLLVLVEHSLRILREDREAAGWFRHRFRELQGMLEELLREGVERGELRKMNTRSMARTISLLIEAAILQFSVDSRTSLQTVSEGVEHLLRGLRA